MRVRVRVCVHVMLRGAGCGWEGGGRCGRVMLSGHLVGGLWWVARVGVGVVHGEGG